jgi:hypothetical protein
MIIWLRQAQPLLVKVTIIFPEAMSEIAQAKNPKCPFANKLAESANGLKVIVRFRNRYFISERLLITTPMLTPAGKALANGADAGE